MRAEEVLAVGSRLKSYAKKASISGERTRKLMKKLNLVVKQRVAYKVTTKRKHGDQVADNLLNQNLNPVAANEVWAGDITYRVPGVQGKYRSLNEPRTCLKCAC